MRLRGTEGAVLPRSDERSHVEEALERQKLEERLMDVQRNARCVWRAVRLMVFLTALAIVGLGHTTVLIPEWPYTIRQFMMQWPIKAHCALGLASLSCALIFFGLGLRYRAELTSLRLECRRLADQTMQSGDRRLVPLGAGNNAETPLAVPLQDAA